MPYKIILIDILHFVNNMAVLSVKLGSVVGEWIRFFVVYYIRDGNCNIYVDLFQFCKTLLLNVTNFRPKSFVSAYIKLFKENIILL